MLMFVYPNPGGSITASRVEGSRVSHDCVQQSDYVYAWDRKDIIQPIDLNLFKKIGKRLPFSSGTASFEQPIRKCLGIQESVFNKKIRCGRDR
jgi:hypothetical protein